MEDNKYESRKRVKNNEKKIKVTSEAFTRDELTIGDLANRSGLSSRTVDRWLAIGVIPSPIWSRPGRKKKGFRHRYPNRHRFSRDYAEALRDCVVIKNSSCGYGKNSALKKLCYSRLLKFI
jgi:hypothetical protein